MTRFTPRVCVSACLATLVACSSSSKPPSVDDAATETGGPHELQEDEVFDRLFDTTHIVDVVITLPEASVSALHDNPRAYVSAGIDIDGEHLDDVGMHLKGSSSFQELSGKPSLKVRFDAFEEDQTLGKIHRLTLNNMVQDTSQAREMLTYGFWREAGGNAPRANYARVRINDTAYGLYLLLEPMDHDYLQRRYGYADGDLWEGADGADVTPDLVGVFQLKSGEGEGDRAHLEEVATRINTASSDYYAAADKDVVMEDALDYWALMNATATVDGYPYHLNDWFLYADPGEGGRFRLSPWGMDESWNPTFAFQWGVGKLLFNCAADYDCLQRVKARVEAKLELLESSGADAELQRLYDLSAADVASDTRRGMPLADVDAARTDLLTLVRSWPTTLRAQLAAAR